MRIASALAAVILATFSLAGCGSDNDISKDEIAKANASKFDDAARAKVAEGMKAGADKAKNQQSDWISKHPEDVARINAERKQYGLPPLGG